MGLSKGTRQERVRLLRAMCWTASKITQATDIFFKRKGKKRKRETEREGKDKLSGDVLNALYAFHFFISLSLKEVQLRALFWRWKKKMWFRKVICSSHPGGSTEIQVVIDPGFKLRIVSSFYVVAADLVKITRVPEIKWTSGRECWTLIRIMLYNSEKLRFPSDISRKKIFFFAFERDISTVFTKA